MANPKEPKERGFGELVNALVELRDSCLSKIVDEEYPRPEDYDKYGGISKFNEEVRKDYEQRRKALVSELDRRGELFYCSESK